MKKLLALVLALVMTLSLCTISNAAFTDAKDVDASYEEAVAVLNGMGVFKGYEDGSFKPEGSITRAEVAAIVYRLYTGDVKDKQAGLYAGYGKFDDMAGATWAAGYVGFCANAGFVKGYGNGKFGPSDPVTGYQALAMILRAVGYGKNGEFEGADWELHVAQIAQQLKVLKNVKGVSLKAAASRELVAELLFQVAAEVPMVTYTPALGYTNLNALINGQKNDTLGYKNFGLTKVEGTQDKWGRPSHKWTNGKTTVYATIQDKPVATYQKAVTECDVAHDLGLKTNEVMDVYDNGNNAVADWTIRPLATTAKKGAQGQQIEIYKLANGSFRAVVIDTYLAKVIKNSDLTYDNAGHVRTYAKIELAVYGTKVNAEAASANLTLESATANFPYVKGDYVLVNKHNTPAKSDILGKAESIDGSQTIIYSDIYKHTVNGTDYLDAIRFNLDMAQKDGKMKYTWFFDQFGNLIGNKQIANVYSYGTITSMWWLDIGETGSGKAMATVVYMDGTSETIELNSVNAKPLSYSYAAGGLGAPMDASTSIMYLATYASTNYAADNNIAAQNKARYIAGTVGTVKDGHLYSFLKDETTGKVDATVIANPTTPTALNMVDQNAATVTPKVSFIAGNIRTNDSTVFLIQKVGATAAAAKTYESFTGYSNIPALQNAVADAIDLDGDGYADYVYLTGDPANLYTSGLFFASSSAVTGTSASGVSYSYDSATKEYSVYGYVDGKPDAIKVSNAIGSNNWDAGNNVSSKLVADTLYVVQYENGMAVNIVPVNGANTIANYATATYNKTFTVADYVNYSVVKAQNGNTTSNNYVPTTPSSSSYFIGGATCVIPGTAFGDMTDKTVYLVYGAGGSVAYAYIIDQDNCTVAVADETNATGYVTVFGETAHVTKVASGTKVAFCVTPNAGYEVTGYTVNGVAGNASDIVKSGSLAYVGLTVTGNTTVDFIVEKADTSAALPTTLSATADSSTLDTNVKGYTTVLEAVAKATTANLTGATNVTVSVKDTTAGNKVAAQIFASAPTAEAAFTATPAPATASAFTVSGNVNSNSYIVIASQVGSTTHYVAYKVVA